ncbi:uncharacterized protein LOC135839951 [Planococcus citri]|uniref:uncharacterized protein LOC135839951 n=1 Tax=Planococcus citri TaxID=170843 RepID=UPI0031F97C67
MQFGEFCYFFNMIILIVLSLLSYSSCEESSSPKYPENTADISSINNLAYKPPITLDPRIRKALLNVLNRLEEQEKSKTADTKSDAQKYEQQQQIFDTKSNPKQYEQQVPVNDDVKWEYKSNDSGKDYGFYEIIQDKPSPTLPTTSTTNDESPDKEKTEDEPGALFFQVPDKQEEASKEKHESLNLQETKSALTSDLIFGHLEDEIKQERKNTKDSNNTSNSQSESAEEDVEVFQAPLLTAFTLEQDERGLPRRIIPLDTAELSSILDNKINVDPTQEIRKAREQQNTRSSEPPALPQNDQKRYQLNLESQLLQLQEQKRQLDLEKQRFLIEQEKQKFFAEQENNRRLKIALELRDRENFFRSIKQNEIPRQEVALQKSIPLEIYNKPVILQPLPLVPVPLIQYKPQFEFPETVDRQLQNLFQRSGITQGKHEDLNIVSKVLALNYDEKDKPKISAERLRTASGNFRTKRRPDDKFWGV